MVSILITALNSESPDESGPKVRIYDELIKIKVGETRAKVVHGGVCVVTRRRNRPINSIRRSAVNDGKA